MPASVLFLLQELAGTDSDNKNWRGILIALLVIVVVCGLVIVAVVLVTPRQCDGPLICLSVLFSGYVFQIVFLGVPVSICMCVRVCVSLCACVCSARACV